MDKINPRNAGKIFFLREIVTSLKPVKKKPHKCETVWFFSLPSNWINCDIARGRSKSNHHNAGKKVYDVVSRFLTTGVTPATWGRKMTSGLTVQPQKE